MAEKYKLPTVEEFLSKKTLTRPPKLEPVWLYLEREMRAREAEKPYNEVVGEWLRFLKDLKAHYRTEAKKRTRRLTRDCGPTWYVQLSTQQQRVLDDMPLQIHKDLIAGVPTNTRRALADLGCEIKLPDHVMMETMTASAEDTGVFLWLLYSIVYKNSPSELLPEQAYDIDAKLLMSSMVYVDLAECVARLEEMCRCRRKLPRKPAEKPPRNSQPDVQFGEYLQTTHAPCYRPAGVRRRAAAPLDYKVKLRTENSLDRLRKDRSFLQQRKDRQQKAKPEERVCEYNFWQPKKAIVRGNDPRMQEIAQKTAMISKKPTLRCKALLKNIQYHVGDVTYSGGKPNYVINSVSIMDTGYIAVNAGLVTVRAGPGPAECITVISGSWRYPVLGEDRCERACDCMKWESAVMDYIKATKCMCSHNYDFRASATRLPPPGRAEKYFSPPTRHGPFAIDYGKIYTMDPREEFIKNTVAVALRSKDPTPTPSVPSMSASGLRVDILLGALLADLSDSPLIIPHLPQASRLRSLQEWVRHRIEGPLKAKKKQQILLKAERRTADVGREPWRARAYHVPFTQRQLKHMTFGYAAGIQKLYHILLEDFKARNQRAQLRYARLFWGALQWDPMPDKIFPDIFFTYMPARRQDVFMIHPYDTNEVNHNGGKTCPL